MENTSLKNWKAPEGAVVPDFIMCGAMKCGTSTIHGILRKHPDILMPNKEIGFFDIDNMLQHNDFTFKKNGKWYFQNIENNYHKFWDWYSAQFVGEHKNKVIGEDSTTYLASPRAAQRIAIQNKKVKIIIMLRNPVKRTYSHYWHLFRSGRATLSFEDTLLYNPYEILSRSQYFEQLKVYFDLFPRENIKVILFEDFLKDKKATLNEICDYIGIDSSQLPKDALELHNNPSRLPKFHKMQLLVNSKMRGMISKRYMGALPVSPLEKNTQSVEIEKPKGKRSLFKTIYQTINPVIITAPPKMSEGTERFLTEYFKNELQGLNELLGRDVLSIWFK